VGFKSFAPHVRASDEEEKCLPQVGNGSRGMDGCAVQCRAGAACRPGSRRRLLDSWATRRRRGYTLVDSENREGCNRVTPSLIISLAYNQAMSVRDKMNLGSFCGHVANGRVTEIINKIIMRTSEHRHDQAIAFRFPSFQSDVHHRNGAGQRFKEL